MALGEAFITIRADTSKFKAELATLLKAELAEAEQTAAATQKAAKTEAAASNAVTKSIAKQTDAEKQLRAEEALRAKAAIAQQVKRAKELDAAAKQIKSGALAKRLADEKQIVQAVKAQEAAYRNLAKGVAKSFGDQAAAAEKAKTAIAKQAAKDAAAETKAAARRIKDVAAEEKAEASAAKAREAIARREARTLATLNNQRTKAARDAFTERTRLSAQQDRDAAREVARIKAVQKAAVTAARARAAAEREAGRTGAGARSAATQLTNQLRGAAREPNRTRTERVERVRVIITESGSKGVIAALGAIRAEAQKIGKSTGFSQLISVGAGAAATSLNVLAQAFKFATIGAIGLGGALAFVGLESADKIQAAKIGFEGLADAIVDTTPKIDEFSKTAKQTFNDLGSSQEAAAGFVNQLQQIARESAISQQTLFSTSQQLLSLGYNGQQTKDILLSLGGALASSGKSGGELNENLRGVVTAFSQIQGAGRLLAQDLNQITTRIPALTRSKFLTQFIADTKHAGDATKVTRKELEATQAEFRKGNLNINSDAAIKALLTVGQQLDRTAARAAALRETFKTQFAQIGKSASLTVQDLNSVLDNKAIGKNLDDKVYLELAKSIDLVGKRTKSLTADQKKAVQDAIAAGKITGKAGAEAIAEGIGANASALKRINEETFGGAFEALKDTIRQQLGQAFADPKVAQPILDVLGKLGDEVGPIIDKLAPKLAAFSASLFGALGNALPAIATAVGQVFDVLGTALNAIGPKLPAIIAGFGQLFEIINQVATSDAAKELFNALGEAIPQIVDGLAAAGPAFAVVGDAAASLIEIVLQLAPAVKGLGEVLGAIGIILIPIAALLRVIKEAIDFIPPGVIEAVGALVAILGTFVAVVTAVSIIGPAVAAALAAITVGVEALTIALLANPIGLAIAAVVALTIGLVLLARKFEPVRIALTEGLELIARAFTFQIDIMLLAIQGLFKAFDKVGGFLGHVIPGLGGLADKAGAAADEIGNLRSSMDGAVGSISELGAKTDSLGSSVTASRASIAAFNSAARDAGLQVLDASASVDQLNAAIAKLPETKRIQILVDIGVSNTAALKGAINSKFNAGAKTGLEDATGFSTEGINAAAKAASDSALKITDGFVNSLPGGSTSGTGGSGGSSKAETAAKKFADRIRTILQGLDKEFKTGLIEGDAKNVRKTLGKLARSIIDAFADSGKAKPTKLLARLERESKRLQKLVQQRIDLVKRLKDAEDATKSAIEDVGSFASITGAFDELSESVKGATSSLADLSRLKIIRPGQDTIGGLSVQASAAQAAGNQLDDVLKARLKAIQDFQADLATLIARGVNRDLVQQIVEAGVSGGAGTADALANASDSAIASINATQEQIDKAAKELGTTAGDVAASVGKNVVIGIVQGLKDQKSELTKSITELVNVIIKRLKDGLKIKSPSQVTAFIGRMTGKGLINALRGSVPHVRSAAAHIAKAAIPNLAAVELPGLSLPDLATPRVNVDPIGDALAKAKFAPVSVDALLRLADSKSLEGLKANLEAAQPVRSPQSRPDPIERQGLSQGIGPADVDRMVRAMGKIPGATKTIEAPITNHFHGASADPHAAARHISRAVARI